MATVVGRAGGRLTLDLGGDRIVALGDARVGDSVVVTFGPGRRRVTRTGNSATIDSVGTLRLRAGETLPPRARVTVERSTAIPPESDFGESHRVVPTLYTFEYAARSLRP